MGAIVTLTPLQPVLTKGFLVLLVKEDLDGQLSLFEVFGLEELHKQDNNADGGQYYLNG